MISLLGRGKRELNAQEAADSTADQANIDLVKAKSEYEAYKNQFVNAQLVVKGKVPEDAQALILEAWVKAGREAPDPDFVVPLHKLKEKEPKAADLNASIGKLGLLGDIRIVEKTGKLGGQFIYYVTTGRCPERKPIREGIQQIVSRYLEDKKLALEGGIQVLNQFEDFFIQAFSRDPGRRDEIIATYEKLSGDEAMAFITEVRNEAFRNGYITKEEAENVVYHKFSFHPGWIPRGCIDELQQIFTLADQHPELERQLGPALGLKKKVAVAEWYHEARDTPGIFQYAIGTPKHGKEAHDWLKETMKRYDLEKLQKELGQFQEDKSTGNVRKLPTLGTLGF